MEGIFVGGCGLYKLLQAQGTVAEEEKRMGGLWVIREEKNQERSLVLRIGDERGEPIRQRQKRVEVIVNPNLRTLDRGCNRCFGGWTLVVLV